MISNAPYAASVVQNYISHTMDETDRQLTVEFLTATQSGDWKEWINPDTTYRFRIIPLKSWATDDGICRQFELEVKHGTEPEESGIGTACRQADSSWLVLPS